MKRPGFHWLSQAALPAAVLAAASLVALPQTTAPRRPAKASPAATSPPASPATARGATVPAGPRVEVIPLKRADAVTAARIIRQVMLQDPVTIEADARTNSLIMIGLPGQIRVVRQLAARLDVPLSAGTAAASQPIHR